MVRRTLRQAAGTLRVTARLAGVTALLLAMSTAGMSGTATGASRSADDCDRPDAMPTLAFGPTRLIDPTKTAAGPIVRGMPDGTLLYVAVAPAMTPKRDTPRLATVHIWRSIDGGDEWRAVRQNERMAAHSGFSGADIAVDTAGNAYMAGVSQAGVYLAKSEDSGVTWASHPINPELADGARLAADQEDAVYLSGNQTPRERALWKSTDGGATFDLANPVPLPGSGPQSNMLVDPTDGRLYVGDDHGGIAIYPNVRHGDFTRIDIDDATETRASRSVMAMDQEGNVYVVSSTLHQVFVSHSADRGLTWATTAIHDTTSDAHDGLGEVLSPWISAGADGRVGVSWLQADQTVPTDEATPVAHRIYAAQSLTGHGWIDECGTHDPVYEVAVATPEPFHVGATCDTASTCHTNTITADGSLAIAYTRASSKPEGFVSHPGLVRQIGGVDFTGDESAPAQPDRGRSQKPARPVVVPAEPPAVSEHASAAGDRAADVNSAAPVAAHVGEPAADSDGADRDAPGRGEPAASLAPATRATEFTTWGGSGLATMTDPDVGTMASNSFATTSAALLHEQARTWLFWCASFTALASIVLLAIALGRTPRRDGGNMSCRAPARRNPDIWH